MTDKNNNYEGYLMVHFTGESKDGEQVYFSISQDGLYWKELNNGNPILKSTVGEKGVRDPFIIRSACGSKFYIIATDLRIHSGKGWGSAVSAGSRSIVIWESEDLIHWSNERLVEIGIPLAGCVWAPEAIYDEENQDYLVFWASSVQEQGEDSAKHRIYASRTKDFYNFTQPVKYIERDNHIIDTTIIKQDDYYYRFSKDETTKNIRCDRGLSLSGKFENISLPKLESLKGVEGPAGVYLYERNEWCLMLDRFAENKGYLPLVSKNIQKDDFKVIDDSEFDLGKTTKRHGSLINLTKEEYKRLCHSFGDANPVLTGLYADPDLALFDGSYYIYPTTDGFPGWSGTKFHVFSSLDLINWKDEGVILDVVSDDVAWSTGSAWAPAIARKDNSYYFYFCAKNKEGDSSIGVAMAPSPTGPFTAQEKPLITIDLLRELNIPMGQAIDPSIFTDENGDNYLLFGNGNAAIVKLEDDMVRIDLSTMKPLEGAYDFREAITVLKRNGLYHFTWSCDDTGSDNYHVNYGTSTNLYGPIEYHYPILEKDSAADILGTGHHSICKTGEDEYTIAYHRFATPLQKYPEGKGYYRETCLSHLNFDENGWIKKVIVTP